MKIVYFDCSMGAAGDMLSSSLLSALKSEEIEVILKKVNEAGIPNVKVELEDVEKCSILGKGLNVFINYDEKIVQEDDNTYCNHDHNHEHNHDHNHEHNHDHNHEHNHDHNHEHSHEHNHEHHSHNTLKNISDIIENLNLSQNIKKDILNVYKIIADAESKAHGQKMENIHFHEVGTMDALADITTFCVAMDYISPKRIFSSAVNTGKGHIHCAHGILPVPAPATANILLDIPSYCNDIESELCTPTGAALLKYFVDEFCDAPIMKTSSIGYGMGKREFKIANCLRAFIGEKQEQFDEKALELMFNVDDMTAEDIGFATERIFETGAYEVFCTPVTMKKSRPGTMITVICNINDREKILKTIFKNTTTIGIRENITKRYTLKREIEYIDTKYGKVRKKVSRGYGVEKEKFEYEDISKIAKENELSLFEIKESIK